ncbi:MAG TPA: mechanosensitive ion channel domain-containing protein, partial [Croceibacterium sp.]|nr:mechanosensitive ion channel domain-containing protein [Croceibacterium sp.]
GPEMSKVTRVLQDAAPDSGLGTFVDALDRWGVTIADARISIWTVLVAVVVLAAALLFARLAIRMAKWLLGKVHGIDTTQQLLAQKLVSIAIWILTFLLVIDIIGIDLTALAVFSGAFGLALGFGLQKTFGNLLAGIILLMDRSIKPGDVIAVNDGITNTVGQVKKIGIRAVSVTTRDKKEYLIPNENLMINQVENWSYSSREVRIRVPLTISAASDLELAERLMLEAASASPRVLKTPPPAVWLTAIDENGLSFEIRFWIHDPEEGLTNVRSDILKRVWHLFQQDGVELPNRAQRDLSLRDSTALRELLAAVKAADERASKPAKGNS